ncbi:unnamed protein product [Rotaria sp. Silwood1]|nr:unnamed protein product [Rotaria sp. Silwood1]
MATYNRWAFQQLYNKLDKHISNEHYHADNGLYFRSIHGTLVHLLLSSLGKGILGPHGRPASDATDLTSTSCTLIKSCKT